MNECHRLKPSERPASDRGPDRHRDRDDQQVGAGDAAERGEPVETVYPAEGNHRVLTGHSSNDDTDERRR